MMRARAGALVLAAAAASAQPVRRLPHADSVAPGRRVARAEVLISVETTNAEAIKAGGLIDGQCRTWLQGFKHVYIFVDDASGLVLPASCREAQVRNCCGNVTTLGDTLATAQYKREHIHRRLAQELPRGVRWVLSTEGDVWWDPLTLLEYLGVLEARTDPLVDPVLAAHWWGPF